MYPVSNNVDLISVIIRVGVYIKLLKTIAIKMEHIYFIRQFNLVFYVIQL